VEIENIKSATVVVEKNVTDDRWAITTFFSTKSKILALLRDYLEYYYWYPLS
jgi:hypothetical protein